ncbi:alkaline-phosphatase-like protein [Xylariaceae sp. FL1272]|nr:alkaline-phosphatase-like protein [Xylariaceae sp. FL1272]
MYRKHASPLPRLLLVIANILIPAAILIFATGFFPYKPFLPGLAKYDDLQNASPPNAPFDKLVFMVVDALRSDFVFVEGSGFQFTQNLINNGVAVPFTAHATSPTVTMPRIKAMTTGSTPSFLDAILNFDEADTSSTLAAQDTWLAQMKAKDTGKLVMYGDDTWLKLFPGTFDRADGTTSFFVSDFTQVDNNVTRHVPDELLNDDWNTMVLHYLGLDHIGHKTGPRGPNMIPKQHEMDGIVRQIYEAMETQDHLKSTLLVLCGDHGMNDAGNHGASSPGETSAALVFVSPKLRQISGHVTAPVHYAEDFQYYRSVEQSDLAPTLAALLGFAVPRNSLGSFIVEFLPLWSDGKLHILVQNARQILSIVTASMGASSPETAVSAEECLHAPSPAAELVCEWQNVISGIADEVTTTSSQHHAQWLSKAQEMMSRMASNYDVDRLTLGGVIALIASSAATVAALQSAQSDVGGLGPFMFITTVYSVMMFASSYVEEEQHFWYWSTTAWLFYLALRRLPSPTRKFFLTAGGGLVIMRLARSWNQTGQKFAGEPDIVTTYLVPHPTLMWILVWSTYLLSSRELLRSLGGIPTILSGSVVAGVVTSAVSFKLSFAKQDAPELVVGVARFFANLFDGPSLVVQARTVFMGIGLTALYPAFILIVSSAKASKESALRGFHHLYTLIALTQSRTTNAPLFLIFYGIEYYLYKLDLKPIEVTTSALLLQYASFFAMGGSNAFTGIDLSSAYNGVSDFNVFLVGILTFVSNWAGPIWWMSASNLLLLRTRSYDLGGTEAGGNSARPNAFLQHASLLTVFVAVTLGFVMVACTTLRTHLFIWTVFSPKYLYSMAWSLGQHLVVNMGLGGLLYSLGNVP